MKPKILLIILALSALAVLLFARVGGKPWVDRSDCVGCGDCVKACPTQAITVQNGRACIDPDLCIECNFCVRACTYNAIRSAR